MFEILVAEMDENNIIKKESINNPSNSNLKCSNLTTLTSEYRKIEIFKFIENETVALEIIKTDKDPKKFSVKDGVRNFMGCVYSL